MLIGMRADAANIDRAEQIEPKYVTFEDEKKCASAPSIIMVKIDLHTPYADHSFGAGIQKGHGKECPGLVNNM